MDFRYPNSTIEENARQSQTLADVYDVVNSVPSSFDLPIDEIKTYVNDLMINQIGTRVLVDGQEEYIMLSDLRRRYTNLQDNMKDCVFLHTTKAVRGSVVDFPNESQAVVYDIPNDDIVSYSSRLLIFNNVLEFFVPSSVYDTNPESPTYGDTIQYTLKPKEQVNVFVERIDGYLRNHDVGLLHDSLYRVIGAQSELNTDVEDVVRFQGRFFEVSDVDKITSGICTLQLRTTRSDYSKYIILE